MEKYLKETKMDLENLIRENIKTMQPYSSARGEFQDYEEKMIYLDANENPNENGINRYPDTQQKAVKKILSEIKKVSKNQLFTKFIFLFQFFILSMFDLFYFKTVFLFLIQMKK